MYTLIISTNKSYKRYKYTEIQLYTVVVVWVIVCMLAMFSGCYCFM